MPGYNVTRASVSFQADSTTLFILTANMCNESNEELRKKYIKLK